MMRREKPNYRNVLKLGKHAEAYLTPFGSAAFFKILKQSINPKRGVVEP